MGAVRPFRQAGEMRYLQDSSALRLVCRAPTILPMHDLVIEHDGVSLAATYSPAGDTALVALHGAGEGTRNYFLYRHLHELLPPAGIGVVTFDRRGDGESTGDASRGRFEVQAGDALAVREAVGVGRVGLWGFSQGGWIAPLAAAQSDRVAFVVGVASTGVTPSEQMMYATAEQLGCAGYGQAVVKRALALRRAYEDHVHGRSPGREDELAAELRAAMDEPWWLLAFLPPIPLDAEGCRLWIEEMDFDPRPVFEQVRVPALLFYGEDDSWTPVEPSAAAWREARGDEVDVVVIPEASHEMTLPDGTIAPEYERRLVDWLVGRARG
jgi:pimeloyl-ACP methyl ester carboxylesterase